ncbi:hypothetical protein BJQ90_03646 [Arthrobacter sp. SO3]|nr:hypothetical protein [Arthrobacter sp. SO3]
MAQRPYYSILKKVRSVFVIGEETAGQVEECKFNPVCRLSHCHWCDNASDFDEWMALNLERIHQLLEGFGSMLVSLHSQDLHEWAGERGRQWYWPNYFPGRLPVHPIYVCLNPLEEIRDCPLTNKLEVAVLGSIALDLASHGATEEF